MDRRSDTPPGRAATRVTTDAAATPTRGEPPVVVREPRQRWRITFARDPIPPELAGRALLDSWHAALGESGLPVARLDGAEGARPRLWFAAPLPAGAAGERELLDVLLLERRRRWEVREAIATRMPMGHRWVDAEDVWVAAPPLPGRVVAAEWRVDVVAAEAVAFERVRRAAERVLASPSLPRIRLKGDQERHFDLRPLLDDIVVGDGQTPGESLTLRIRTRLDPELGAGRPDEVVAALADAASVGLDIVATTRERVVLASDPGSEQARPGSTKRSSAGATRRDGRTPPGSRFAGESGSRPAPERMETSPLD